MFWSQFETFNDISPFSVVVAVVAILLVIMYYVMKNKGLPPGPTGLPLVGIWPFMKNDVFHLQLLEMQKKYGELFSFTVAGHLFINMGTVKLIREAHVSKSENFGSRVTDFNVFNLALKDGVGLVNGEEWKVLRKFFVQVFKEYGMTSIKDNMVGSIYDSLNLAVEEFHAKQGQCIKVTELLVDKCLTITRRMLFNDDGMSTEELQEFLRLYEIMMGSMTPNNFLLNGEFARYFILPYQNGFKAAKENEKNMNDILYKVVNRHESNFDEDQIKDVIDSFIKERRDRAKRGDPTAKMFTDKALVSSLAQIVGDGIISVAMFIGFFLYILAEHPEEQEKVYQELLEVVGPNRQPTMEDKSNLPYTNAFILEALRTMCFFPFFPSLECTKETTLRGYRIPKGTITLMNLYAAHNDPEVYEEPEKFNPSRFISVPGKQRPELPVLFGIGKRACAGEAFTMIQVFLFVTTIVKNFRLSLPEGMTTKHFFERMEICAHSRAAK